MSGLDPARSEDQRRRLLERLEMDVVRLQIDSDSRSSRRIALTLRYVLSLARLTRVRNALGEDVEVTGHLAAHARMVRDTLTPRLADAAALEPFEELLPDLIAQTCLVRDEILRSTSLTRDILEEEVTTRPLVVVSGGGGGAGYVYPGAYEAIERVGRIPDLMVGTSIGALLSMFRCRRKRWDLAPLVAASRSLSWGGVFRVLEGENRYGLPATLRLHLQAALGHLFQHPSGRPLWLSDLPIPLMVVVSGITVDALQHELKHYEHLMDQSIRRSRQAWMIGGSFKILRTLGEFVSKRDALVQVVLGRDPGTEDFDVIDAAGFSSAIPGVIHYDVLREDPRMHRMLDRLYTRNGISRLGEGGLMSNVPARVAWEAVQAGKLGRRNALVVALDCFSPNLRQPGWLALQSMVRWANTEKDRQYADLYVRFPRTLSPVNLVPSMPEALQAFKWGRAAMEAHVPVLKAALEPLPVLHPAGELVESTGTAG